MSIHIMALVWERAPYDGGTLLALLALADWANEEGVTWPSIAQIASKSRMKPRNAQYILRALEADGMLTREQAGKGRSTTVYRINLATLNALPLVWQRPNATAPVPVREQNEIPDEFAPMQNLQDATQCTSGVQPSAPLPCNDCTSAMQPSAPQGCNPVHPIRHRSVNEPKDPLPPDKLGGEPLATQGVGREQKSRSEDAPLSSATGDQTRSVITRAERSALLKTVWREWDMGDEGEPSPPDQPPVPRGPP